MEGLGKIERDIGRMESDIDSMKTDIREIRDDNSKIKSDISEIKSTIVQASTAYRVSQRILIGISLLIGGIAGFAIKFFSVLFK